MVSCFCCYGAIKNLQFFEANHSMLKVLSGHSDSRLGSCASVPRASQTARQGELLARRCRASKACPKPPIPHCTAFKATQAYLLLILMEWGYSLFQIGVLHSVTFAFTYVFEVPSGLIADHFGKKNELLLCFVWYMFSFAFYLRSTHSATSSFWVLVLASGFYGLGEAFRSGTHKVMICAWLDKHEIGGYKKFI